MNDFITLEDINSTFLKYGHVNSFYECDTSKINKTGLYTDIIYDFIKVSRTSTGFKFKIENKLWCGGYYILDSDGNYIPMSEYSVSFNDNTITLTINESNIILVLYLTSMYNSFSLKNLKWRPVKLGQYNYTPVNDNPIHEEIIDLLEIHSAGDTITANNITDGQHTETFVIVEENDKLYLTTNSTVDSTGIFKFNDNWGGVYYYSRFMESKIIEITPAVENITLGKINKVYFNLSGTTIQTNIKGTATYNGITTDLEHDNN